MKAHLKEVKDNNGKVMIATVLVTTPDLKPNTLAAGRAMLNTDLGTYIGSRLHTTYHHSESDTVGAVVTFDMDKHPGQDVEI